MCEKVKSDHEQFSGSKVNFSSEQVIFPGYQL